MDVTQVVAGNARRIREQKKLTLDAAAAATGVSRSMLAQIEKGEVNPTISVLWKMANGYKVSFTSLMEPRTGAVCVVRQAEITPLTEEDGRYRNYPVFPFDEQLPQLVRLFFIASLSYLKPYREASQDSLAGRYSFASFLRAFIMLSVAILSSMEPGLSVSPHSYG